MCFKRMFNEFRKGVGQWERLLQTTENAKALLDIDSILSITFF